MLATNYSETNGWVNNTTHNYELIYETDRIRISIDTIPIFDVSGSFEPGRFGFYNYSQQKVRYAASTIDTSSPIFITPPGDYSTLIKNLDGSFTRTLKNGTEIDFDSDGFQTSVVDRNGNTTSYAYDVNDNLTTITDPVGMVTTLEYTNGLLTKVTDPAGRETLFEHDGDGNLIKITDPDGTFRQFSYDADHKLVSKTSKRGHTSAYTYNFAGRFTQSVRPDGSIWTIEPKMIVGLADTANGQGTKTNPAPVMQEEDNITTITDGNGNVSFYKTNEFGGVAEFTDALGRTTVTTRDENNNVIQSIDPRGHIIDITYDDNGNILTINNQSIGVSTTFTYTTDGFNNIKTITDPNNNTTTFNYDVNGNIIEEIDALSNKTTNTFNSSGQVTTTTDALNSSFIINYDATSGNIIGIVEQLGNETINILDSSGNIISVIDRLNRTTNFIYDNMNRLLKVVDPDLAETSNGYDEERNLISVTDARGNTTTFSYDNVNRIIRKTDPLGNSDSATYDEKTNIISSTNRNGDTINYEYDGFDRLINKILPGNEVTTYIYDDSNNLIEITDPDSKLTMTYDGNNRISNVSTAGSSSQPVVDISYTYDTYGNLISLTDSINGTTSYAYDNNNRLTSLTNPSNLTVTYNYDQLNRPILRTYPNGVTTLYEYNARGDLTKIANDNSSNVISSFNYTYDDVNKRVALDQTRSSVTVNSHIDYGYDNLDRLTSAINQISDNPDESFSYDVVGNRLLQQGQTSPSEFNENNQLLEDQNFIYQYDLNGNLIRKTSKNSSDVTEFTYDAENKLIKVDNNGIITEYKYDGLGRRIEKNINGTIKKHVYQNSIERIKFGSNFLFEFDGSDNLLATYTNSFGIDTPLIVEDASQTHFYLTDGLNSITEMSSLSGDINQEYVYDSFGNVLLNNGNIENEYTFTTRELDVQNNLYYFRNRYYNSLTGRFLQEDPIGFDGGVNFYTYVGNSPTNFIDPLGLGESFPLDPNIPFPYIPIPLPDVVGCFGLVAFGNLSWLSSNPTKTNYGLNGAGLGGGIILCYKLDCDSCPKGKGLDKFSFGLSKLFKKRIGVAAGGTLDGNICFAVGPFGSFTPISFAGNLGSF